MTEPVYLCGDDRRRSALLAPGAPANLTGIDFLTVEVGPPLRLIVDLVKPVPLAVANITDATVRLTGGVRYPAPVGVVTVVGPPGKAARLVVTFAADAQTDFSTYVLRLVTGPADPSPPPWVDPRLAEVAFSFKVDCPSDFDCAPPCPPPAAPGKDAIFDYRARDYPGFRRLMLDRLAAVIPGFSGEAPADFTTTMVEALAYQADQASYRLDFVGTEAFLGTARARVSLRRHARLVDYSVGEGAGARVFIEFDVSPGIGLAADGLTLPAATPLLPRSPGLGPMVQAAAYRALLACQPVVFETVGEARLWAWRNAIAIHTWSDDLCVLPKDATAVTLVDGSLGVPGALAAGDLLLLAETRSPLTGLAADRRLDHRQVVRLTRVNTTIDPLAPGLALIDVAWAPEDALTFDLTIQALAPGAAAGSAGASCAIARGNVVLADHGLSLPPSVALGLPSADVDALRPILTPATPPDVKAWRPRVRVPAGVVARAPARLVQAPIGGGAAAAMLVDPAQALAAIALDDDFQRWSAQPDLLASGAFSRDFVVEVDIDGEAVLRFGDGRNGLTPAAGATLGVSGRFGSGAQGGLGPEAIAHVVIPATLATATLRASNPLAAMGAADPEPSDLIRARAPEAFRRQDRAVTTDDYAALARRHPEVSDAAAALRWTGAWWTVFIYLDRSGGRPVNDAFAADVAGFMESYRMMGFDVAVRGAKPAPLDLVLEVCARPTEIRAVVAQRVRAALAPVGPDGRPGFFNPDNFRFGTPLYLSALTATVMAVPGVASMRALKFQRWARASLGELSAGVIRPAPLEILRLDDDPSLPENGRLTLTMGGGR